MYTYNVLIILYKFPDLLSLVPQPKILRRLSQVSQNIKDGPLVTATSVVTKLIRRFDQLWVDQEKKSLQSIKPVTTHTKTYTPTTQPQ